VMFGMVASAGLSMLAEVTWNRRNMIIFAVSMAFGLGLYLEPGALQHVPDSIRVLLASGLLPAAFIAIILNLVLPEELADDVAQGAGDD
jgi:xanthine/uracil permease